MIIQELNRTKATVFELEGRLDSSTSSQLEKILLNSLESGKKNMVIDFTRVVYISSAGLRVLLMAAKKSKAAGGKMLLCSLPDNVKDVFDIAGFTSIFSITSSQEEALRSI